MPIYPRMLRLGHSTKQMTLFVFGHPLASLAGLVVEFAPICSVLESLSL